jgi:hypothetical protein
MKPERASKFTLCFIKILIINLTQVRSGGYQISFDFGRKLELNNDSSHAWLSLMPIQGPNHVPREMGRL